MDFLEFALKRESCRKYSDKEIEKEKIEKCLEAARIAPSACNSQPWKFIAVMDEAKRLEIAPLVQGLGMNKFASDAKCLTVVVEQRAKLMDKVLQRFSSQNFAQIDIGIAVSHYCLEATSQGLSTCILGWLNADKIKEVLNLDKDNYVRLVIATGYAQSEELRDKKRKDISEMSEII